MILVRGLLVMLGATGSSEMTVTRTEYSVVPARLRAKQLYQPAEEAVVLHTVSVWEVSLMVVQFCVKS